MLDSYHASHYPLVLSSRSSLRGRTRLASQEQGLREHTWLLSHSEHTTLSIDRRGQKSDHTSSSPTVCSVNGNGLVVA